MQYLIFYEKIGVNSSFASFGFVFCFWLLPEFQSRFGFMTLRKIQDEDQFLPNLKRNDLLHVTSKFDIFAIYIYIKITIGEQFYASP